MKTQQNVFKKPAVIALMGLSLCHGVNSVYANETAEGVSSNDTRVASSAHDSNSAQSEMIKVNRIVFSGTSAFRVARLIEEALGGSAVIGQEHDQETIKGFSDKVRQFYQSHGYPEAHVSLLSYDRLSGLVRMKVMEGGKRVNEAESEPKPMAKPETKPAVTPQVTAEAMPPALLILPPPQPPAEVKPSPTSVTSPVVADAKPATPSSRVFSASAAEDIHQPFVKPLLISLTDSSDVGHPDLKRISTPEQLYALVAGRDKTVSFDQKNFVYWVLSTNPTLLNTEQEVAQAKAQIQYEQGAYEPSLFANASNFQQRSQNSPLGSVPISEERTKSITTGVKRTLSTGAEVSLGYQTQDRFNDLITGTDPKGINDTTGSLTMNVRQPLMRGIGAPQIEGRIEQARKGIDVSKQSVRQQVLSTTYDALSLYWKLYREQALLDLSDQSLDLSQAILKDTNILIKGGRLPEIAKLEAESTVLLRQANREAALQSLDGVKNQIKTLLNLPADHFEGLVFAPLDKPQLGSWKAPTNFADYFEKSLAVWPNYIKLMEKKTIQDINLDMAKDEERDKLDLVVNYGQNSRVFNSAEYQSAFNNAWTTQFPAWTVGVEYTHPLYGNEQARAKMDMARSNITSHQIQENEVRVQLANLLKSRINQVELTFNEYEKHKQNVAVLVELMAAMRDQFQRGLIPVKDLILKEDALNSSRIKMIDAQIRYELSKIALKLSDGSLLREMDLSYDNIHAAQ